MSPHDASESEFKIAAKMVEDGQDYAALSHYKAAIDLDPSDPRYWIGFGASLSALRHWDQAIEALTCGIALGLRYAEADARMMLADALCGAGRAREARREWETVAEMQPSYPSHDAPIQEAKRRLNDPK
jgi:Flp pilus assembly protein TadD